jgi:hypothetical protein
MPGLPPGAARMTSCPASVNIRKARVISSAKNPTGKPLSCAVLETSDRMRRGLRFIPILVSTIRSDAGMAKSFSGYLGKN